MSKGSKNKALDKVKKVNVRSETGKGFYKGNSNERIVPIRMNGGEPRNRFKSSKDNSMKG